MLKVASVSTTVLLDAVPELGNAPAGTSICDPTYIFRLDTGFTWWILHFFSYHPVWLVDPCYHLGFLPPGDHRYKLGQRGLSGGFSQAPLDIF